MVIRRPASILLILAVTSPGFAQEIRERVGGTDRPGNGIAATAVPPLKLQVETSAAYTFDDAGSGEVHLLSFPTLLRFGTFESVELRLSSSIIGVVAGGDRDSLERTDTQIGAKLQLLDSVQGGPDLAVVVDVSLPTGQSPFTGDAVTPDGRAAASWNLPAGFGVLANAGIDVPEDDDGRFARLVYVANLGYTPPVLEGRLAFFAESFGRVALTSARDDIVQIDAGAAYLATGSVQLDLFTQHGLTSASSDFQLSLGLSTRL